MDQTIAFMRDAESERASPCPASPTPSCSTTPARPARARRSAARATTKSSPTSRKRSKLNLSGKESKLIADAEQALTQKLKPAYDALHRGDRRDRPLREERSRRRHLARRRRFLRPSDHRPHDLKMSANDIHELGLSEVARLAADMEVVKKRIGLQGTAEIVLRRSAHEPALSLPEHGTRPQRLPRPRTRAGSASERGAALKPSERCPRPRSK